VPMYLDFSGWNTGTQGACSRGVGVRWRESGVTPKFIKEERKKMVGLP
jgi:hypothetical protein